MQTPHAARLRRLPEALYDFRAAAFLTVHRPNVFYLCGFTGSSGALLVREGKATLITDSRYRLQARNEVAGARVKIAQGRLLDAIARELRPARRLRLAVEAEHLSVAQKAHLERTLRRSVTCVDTAGLVERLRAVKDAEEIRRIRNAARLGSAVFAEILPFLRPGVRESEIAAEIEYRLRRMGASGTAFETIVAFGERSALPHARPTGRKLRRNELVVLDWGAILHGYCCDLTRTVFVGKAPRKVRRWYGAVAEAQQAARNAVQAGTAVGHVDTAARQVLERHGLAKFFTHSTGHGFGLEVHEEPRLAKGQTDALQLNHVITIEPGIYMEGVGGIRIEDDVVVTPQGAELLTSATREFLEL